MHASYWVQLFAFVSLLAVIGLFRNSRELHIEKDAYCEKVPTHHPFMCREKRKIHEATLDELASIDGISIMGAEKIHDFLKRNLQKGIDDLLEIEGIGPKTIESLKVKFF